MASAGLPPGVRSSMAGRLTRVAQPLLAAAILLTGLGAALPAEAAHAGPGEALALTADPTSGTSPLLVHFRLTEPNGTPPALSWDFGDGQFLNSSALAAYEPDHDYLEAGTFHCVVTIRWPNGAVNDSIDIFVRNASLTARVNASPDRGGAPLTVWFNASVSGGTGTYLSYAWTFGDGGNGSGLSLRYTYEHPGRYVATFRAVDSAGASSNATTVVNVSGTEGVPSNASPGSGDEPMGAWATPLGLALLGASTVAVLIAYAAVRRFRTERSPPPTPTPAPGGIPASPAPALATPRPEPSDGSPGATVELRSPERTSPSAPAPSTLTTPTRITDALVRHLAGLPRLGPNDLPTADWTQAGIASSIGAGQSAVSRVLQRLVAAGIVSVETRHVEGSVRRLRIYRLTERGERLGRALREAPADRTPSGPR